MKKTTTALLILAAVLLAASALSATLVWRGADPASGATTSFQPAVPQLDATPSGDVVRYGAGYRYEANGWTFVHIEGKPYERGYQNGRLMADEIAAFQRALEYTTPIDTGHDWSYFIRAASILWDKKKQSEYIQEMKGIAAGATSAGTPLTWREVLAINGNMELLGYWYPGIQSGAYTLGVDKEHCSAFIATGSYTKDGTVVMAHNDWDHFDTGQFANVVLDIDPARGHHMIMQSFPGCIASMTDYFATDAGIMGTETTIGNYDAYDPKKMPEFFRMRRATQYADTLDEWVATMRTGNNGGYANSWLLADTHTSEIMRFEQGLKYDSVERTSDGYFVGFNGATDNKIRDLECGGDPNFFDVRTATGARRVRLTQLMEQYRGSIDVEVAKTILADHYDVYLEKDDDPCSRTVCGHYDVDPFQYWQARRPYVPQGSLDGKVMDSNMAQQLSFAARWGRSCGAPFVAADFFAAHPQWNYLDGYLDDRPTQPWTVFRADPL